jgi:phosphoesterase RecJ-like protein
MSPDGGRIKGRRADAPGVPYLRWLNRSPRSFNLTAAIDRVSDAQSVAALLEPGIRVAITTHVNADGDGTGSEVALWHLLNARGIRAAITNPTPFPDRYAFLLDGIEQADKTGEAVKYVERADAVLVVDISDISRLGQLGSFVEKAGVPVACIDHHLSDGSLPAGPRMVDPTACAAGELVFDLVQATGWKMTPAIARALYVAILTDTGGFRFSNTSSRCLRVAADLLECDVDPEEIYRLIYASNPEGRVRLTSEVLETLVVEPDIGLAWITVPEGSLHRYRVTAEQLDGLVEYPRSIDGVQLALQFRKLVNGRVKISFRSVGEVNVASLAEQFGGGGHRKAAGASIEGTLAAVQARVLDAARVVLREGH